MPCRGVARAFARGLLIFSQKQTTVAVNAYLAVQLVDGRVAAPDSPKNETIYYDLEILINIVVERPAGTTLAAVLTPFVYHAGSCPH